MTHKIDSARLVQALRPTPPRQEYSWSRRFATIFALVSLFWFLLFARAAYAGGPATVTWDQAQDCPSIASWDLLAAVVTTAQPNPSVATATVVTSIANAAPVVCGSSATANVSLSGVGNIRFWLRSRSTGSPQVVSAASNSVTVTLSLMPPAGLSIVSQ